MGIKNIAKKVIHPRGTAKSAARGAAKVTAGARRDLKNVGKGFATPIRGITGTTKALNKAQKPKKRY